MQSRGTPRRPLPMVGRQRQIFTRRRPRQTNAVLVAGTIIVCLALVFIVGFRAGRSFQVESVAAVDKATMASPGVGTVAGVPAVKQQ